MPIVPACGDGVPCAYKTRHTVRPTTDDDMAPTLFMRLVNNPQMNGPRKTAQIAPQDIPRILTMVEGR